MSQNPIIQAYPLQWPAGWKRTTQGWRKPAKFHADFAQAEKELS